MGKQCTNCKITKSLDSYYFRKNTLDKRGSHCKSCVLIRQQKYFQLNQDKIRIKNNEYNAKNRDKKRVYFRIYYYKNREKYLLKSINYRKNNKQIVDSKNLKYQIHKYKTNTFYRLKFSIRNRLRGYLNTKKLNKINKFKDYIGCAKETLKIHIEQQFQPGMTWENHGVKGWHLDHIIPLSSAKTEEEIYKLCHYTNLQPLWWYDNLKKGHKVESKI